MALETNIIEFPITQGQNEGQAVQVLPVGQFSSVRNARYRKNNRLGKRNGYTSKSSLDANSVALGSGGGRLACLGPDFCVVDDRFYRRNAVTDTWVGKPSIGVIGSSRLLWGQFPQFTPGAVIDPPVQETLEPLGSPGPPYSGMTSSLGYIWTAEGRIFNNAWYICVNAIDPSSGVSVFPQDVALTAAAPTDTPGIQLLSMPNGTVVLLADGFTAGVKTSVQCFVLTDFLNGFSLPSSFACIESAANYYPTSTNRILFAHVLAGSPTTVRIGALDPTAGTVTAGTTIASAGNKTLLSVFCLASGGPVVGYFDATNVRASVFDAAFSATGNVNITASVPTGTAPVMFAERATAGVFTLVALMNGTANDMFALGFSTIGVASTVPLRQRNAALMSQPFSVGTTQVFVWIRYVAGEGLGVATLVRVPYDSEFAGGASSLPGVFPIEATLDDREVPAPLAATHAGPIFPTPLALSCGYSALISYTRQSFVNGSVVHYMRSIAVVPVRHLIEGLRYAASEVVQCGDRSFVAAAQPMWVDATGAYEAGFVQAPVSMAPAVATVGGALTAGATYSWAAVFVSESGGTEERSAPSLPVKVAMGANTQVTTRWSTMETGQRRQVTCKVYRTLANGSVFYFVNKFDASPGAGTLGYFDFLDPFSDNDIIQNEALYIDVGQELAASNVPACTFANTGGNRLWCGGGFTGNSVQASKLFTPHVAPEFADDDAFRVSLPAACTGMAWLDSQVLFTQEGIYVVSGDGPDGSGSGFFNKTRLPFNIGCVDWRSVAVCDVGIMFQSPRGLYLLPRGFGNPVPMDQVLDTLTTYPIITSARSDYNSRGGADNSEQLVQWTAVADEAATSGVVITFDVAYKAFYIDTCNADYPATFQSGWRGDAVQSPAVMTVGPGGTSKWHPFRVRDAGFDDDGLTVDMMAETGDIRPWGTFAHGVVNRVGVLMSLCSACTVSAIKTTDRGSRATTRGYTGTAPDYVVGSDVYLDTELGNFEQRDVTALRFRYFESSTLEGMALIAMVIEADKKPQGFRLLQPADRVV